jgi:hypothetical protein
VSITFELSFNSPLEFPELVDADLTDGEPVDPTDHILDVLERLDALSG